MAGSFRFSYASPLGPITLGSDGLALTGLWFDGQRFFGSTLTEDAAVRPLDVFDAAARWLDTYFSGSEPGFTMSLHLNGTPFQKAVWELLISIPYGRTVTYGELADALGAQRGGLRPSPRAVGSAVARNPVSLIVPCHRVVGAGGKLTGYAGGLDRKRRLLQLEGAIE